MALSLGNLLRGAVAQVSPFDRGRTFGTYNPPPKKINVAQLKEALRKQQISREQFLRQLSGPPPPGKYSPGNIAGAAGQATQRVLVQPILRGGVRGAQSITKALHPEIPMPQQFSPSGRIQTNLLGTTPIDTYQKSFAENQQNRGALAASGLLLGSVLGDLPIGPGKTIKGVKGAVASSATKEGAKVIPKLKIRQFPETVKTSQIVQANTPLTAKELNQIIDEVPYMVRPQKSVLKLAVKDFNKNPGQALATALVPAKKALTDKQTADRLVLLAHHLRQGEGEVAGQITKALAPGGTETARGLAMFNAINRTTPSGAFHWATKLGADSPTAMKFYRRAVDIEKIPKGREKDLARAVLLRDTALLDTSSGGEKAQMSLYLAQLLNAKTAARNIGGNIIANIGQNVADVIGTSLDAVVSAVTRKPRSTYFPNLITQAKGLGRGVKEGFQEAKLGVSLGGESKYGYRAGVFKGRVGKNLEKGLGFVLGVADKGFRRAAYDQKLKNLMKGAKVQKPTRELMRKADEYATNMVFEDEGLLARGAIKLKKDVLNAGKEFGVGSIVLNYPRIPANLVNMAIDFSPGGLIKGLVDVAKPLVRKGAFNKDLFVRNVSRGITGTGGLVGTGAMLHKLGIITTDENKENRDLGALQKSTGLGKYKINVSALKRYVLGGFETDDAKLQVGDQLVSYDWAQPLAISLAMGANLDEANSQTGGKDKLKVALGGTIGNAAAGVETLTEQPLLQGVQRLVGNRGGLIQGVAATAQAAPSAFIPALVRQARQLTDNTARNTYDPTFGGKVVATIENAIPGLSKRLSPQVSPLGDVNEVYPQGGNNPFNVAVNPAFVSNFKPNEVTGEVTRLYNETGDKKIVPNPISGTQNIGGKSLILDPEQYSRLQTIYGQTNKRLLSNLFNSPEYQQADDGLKAKLVSNSVSDALRAAKLQLFGGTGKKNEETIKAGGIPDYSGTIKADKRENIQTKFDQSVIDLYAKSKTEIATQLANNPNKDQVYSQLQQYDNALSTAGLIKTPKFKTGLTAQKSGRKSTGRPRGRPRGSGRSGSKRTAKLKLSKAPRAPKLKIAKSRIRKVKKFRTKSSRIRVKKPRKIRVKR